jgi:hypothetical protein
MRALASSATPVAPTQSGGALICLTHRAGGTFELLYRCGVYRDACPSRLLEAA